MTLKKDWKGNIVDLLLSDSAGLTYNEICEKLHANRTSLRNDMDYLIKFSHVKRDKTTSKHTLINPKPDWTSDMLDHSITEHNKKGKEIRQRLRTMRSRTKKPIFKIREETKTTFMYWINPQSRKNLNNYCTLIDNLFALHGALSFKNAFDLNPIAFKKTENKYEKKILICAKELIEKLIKMESKNKRCFETYISGRSEVLRKLESHYSNIMPYGL